MIFFIICQKWHKIVLVGGVCAQKRLVVVCQGLEVFHCRPQYDMDLGTGTGHLLSMRTCAPIIMDDQVLKNAILPSYLRSTEVYVTIH